MGIINFIGGIEVKKYEDMTKDELINILNRNGVIKKVEKLETSKNNTYILIVCIMILIIMVSTKLPVHFTVGAVLGYILGLLACKYDYLDKKIKEVK